MEIKMKPEHLSNEEFLWITMFRNNLKWILKNKHMTITELSEKLGMTYQQFSKYTDGSTKASDELVSKIAEAIGCSVDDLLDETYCSWNYGLSEEEIAKNGRRLS